MLYLIHINWLNVVEHFTFWGLKQSSSDRMHFTNIHLSFLSHYSKDILLFRYGFSLNNLSVIHFFLKKNLISLWISGFDYTHDSVIKWGNKLKIELWKIHVKKYKHVLLSGNWFIIVMCIEVNTFLKKITENFNGYQNIP